MDCPFQMVLPHANGQVGVVSDFRQGPMDLVQRQGQVEEGTTLLSCPGKTEIVHQTAHWVPLPAVDLQEQLTHLHQEQLEGHLRSDFHRYRQCIDGPLSHLRLSGWRAHDHFLLRGIPSQGDAEHRHQSGIE